MRRVFGLIDSATARRLARPLTVVAALLYGVTLWLPFVHGTVRLLFIPASRSLTLLEFMDRLAEKQSLPIVAMVTMVVVVLPLFLLVAALLAAWAPLTKMPSFPRTVISWLRWRAWVVVALGVAFMLGLRTAADATGGPHLRLLPGGWCFCAALVVAALALTVATPTRCPAAPASAAPLY